MLTKHFSAQGDYSVSTQTRLSACEQRQAHSLCPNYGVLCRRKSLNSHQEQRVSDIDTEEEETVSEGDSERDPDELV